MTNVREWQGCPQRGGGGGGREERAMGWMARESGEMSTEVRVRQHQREGERERESGERERINEGEMDEF
jgi:hypothetical protein